MSTLKNDSSYVEVNGICLSYTLHSPHSTTPGSKPTIVLINGLADDQTTWSMQLPAFLSAGYPVLTYDNRGVGESSRPSGKYTAEVLASDCKALVDALSITKPFYLLGVSMGGMIAQSYALAHPSDVLSLTLACTYAKPNEFCERRFTYWEDVAKTMGVPTVMRDVVSWAFTQDLFEPEHAEELREVDEAMKNLDVGVEEYLSQLNVIQMFDTTKHVGELKGVKILVIAGEEDILIPTASSHDLHKLIPGSEWKTVKGGHACMWEFPDEFNQAMIEFLDRSG